MQHSQRESETFVIGAGPAGLAAAYTLAGLGQPVTVLEKSGAAGGLSSSFDHEGFILDFGPHIFTPGRPRVQELWDDVLKDDQVFLRRKTRMYWSGRYFDFPPRLGEFIRRLGFWETLRVGSSLFKSQIGLNRKPANLSEKLSRRYGKRLFTVCFDAYIEKLFGVGCNEIHPDWQPGRLRTTTLRSLIRWMLFGGDDGLLPYPRLGSRQLYDKMVARIREKGQSVRFGSEIVRIEHNDSRITNIVLQPRGADSEEHLPCHGQVVSSMPITLLLQRLSPAPPPEVLREIEILRFRSTVLVYLIVDANGLFQDHCIYVNDREIRTGRIANFANWSPAAMPDKNRTPLCCEFWCNLGDETWTRPDSEIIEQARKDLVQLGLIDQQRIQSTKVLRLPRTHPIPIQSRSEQVWKYLDRFENLQAIGRAGAFSYNDQDDSILMGIRAAERTREQNSDS